MALYIPRSIFHLARVLYVRPETLDPPSYVGKDLKQTAFAYLKANTKIFIWRLSRS